MFWNQCVWQQPLVDGCDIKFLYALEIYSNDSATFFDSNTQERAMTHVWYLWHCSNFTFGLDGFTLGSPKVTLIKITVAYIFVDTAVTDPEGIAAISAVTLDTYKKRVSLHIFSCRSIDLQTGNQLTFQIPLFELLIGQPYRKGHFQNLLRLPAAVEHKCLGLSVSPPLAAKVLSVCPVLRKRWFFKWEKNG